MNKKFLRVLTLAGSAALPGSCGYMGAPAGPSSAGPSFFVTSSNPGRAGDLGGLAGADAHCQRLAASAGLGNRNWRAYLSTQADGGAVAVNARDLPELDQQQ
jgi:hypothetical protein